MLSCLTWQVATEAISVRARKETSRKRSSPGSESRKKTRLVGIPPTKNKVRERDHVMDTLKKVHTV
jgi:hypothetical protein